jgi:hypothetical protein
MGLHGCIPAPGSMLGSHSLRGPIPRPGASRVARGVKPDISRANKTGHLDVLITFPGILVRTNQSQIARDSTNRNAFGNLSRLARRRSSHCAKPPCDFRNAREGGPLNQLFAELGVTGEPGGDL